MRLFLLRHAKSDWTNAEGALDHDRKLAPRGRKAAAALARYFRENGLTPQIILCSTSARTRETVKLILPAFAKAPRVRYLRSLYLTEWKVMLAAIRKMPASARSVLLVGHNPGIEELALALMRAPKTEAERGAERRLRKKYPTGALAILEFDGPSWAQILPGRGRLLRFVRPKDLQAAKGYER
jgi:phosphohistidine phosphatase